MFSLKIWRFSILFIFGIVIVSQFSLFSLAHIGQNISEFTTALCVNLLKKSALPQLSFSSHITNSEQDIWAFH